MITYNFIYVIIYRIDNAVKSYQVTNKSSILPGMIMWNVHNPHYS